MLNIHSYASPEPGPRLLVFGAIHGDEVCGPKAIREVIALLESDKIAIERGRVTFVPICNPPAYAANRRFVDENLNRVMEMHDSPVTREGTSVGNVISIFLEDATAQ